MTRARLFILGLFVVAALPLGAAFAQYPQPLGACTITGPASLAPGASGDYTVTATGTGGAPLAGVTGTVTVTPAGAATASPTSFTTNAQGKATIKVTASATGSQFTISLSCGALTASSVVKIAASSVIPKPPDTGFGATEGSGSTFPMIWVLAGLAAVAAAGTATVAVKSRR